MDFLVLSAPVAPPSEPPSGAFLLASALCGHGHRAGLLDLSLAFYHQWLSRPDCPAQSKQAVTWMSRTTAYCPTAHRNRAGAINGWLKQFGTRYPGWRLSAMDLTPPVPPHKLSALFALLQTDDPLAPLWPSLIDPVLARHRPKQVVISLAYLSQLTGTASLLYYLKSKGIIPVIGGSLPRSLKATGNGFDQLEKMLGPLDCSNGSSLIPGLDSKDFLTRLAFPVVLNQRDYMTGRPIIPLTLSVGCYWHRCLFCPDKEMPYFAVPTRTLADFIGTIPKTIMDRAPIIHLLDSAMPTGPLLRFSELSGSHHLNYYGFARPSTNLLRDGRIEQLAQQGCLMLQMGAEGGDKGLLDLFDKGIDPKISGQVINRAADAGIRTYIYLLFGLPTETPQHRLATQRFLERCGDNVDFLNCSLFNLPVRCHISNQPNKFGIQLGSYGDQPDLITLYRPFSTRDGSFPRRDARLFLQNQLRRIPPVQRAEKRTPKWFRAAHLAMMSIDGRNPQ